MFAPLIARAQPKATANLTNKLAPRHPTLVAQQFGSAAVGPATRGVAWDFSKVPIFPSGQADRSEARSPLSVPPFLDGIQLKLAVGQVDDPLEHEADRVAEQVLQGPPQLQRACACGGTCPKCRTETGHGHDRLHTKSAGSGGRGRTEVPPIVHEVLRSPGQPMDPDTRAFMEARFRHDFSRVRVHTDDRAGDSARSINALAYTAGRHLVFGAGQYSPMTTSGRRLLAHELAHSVQQGFAASPVAPTIGNSGSTLQRQRDPDLPVIDIPAPPEEEHTEHTEHEEAPPKLECPAGFELKSRATWLRCDESSGTKNPGCSFCNKGEQVSRCNEVLKLLGNHNVIAPVEGKCGSKFQITIPQRGARVIDVVKAEIPGGDTKLDINQGVIKDLGLDVRAGRYDVCLKGPIGHDDRLVVTGSSACRKPRKHSKKTKRKNP